jgi:hypothetical protein
MKVASEVLSILARSKKDVKFDATDDDGNTALIYTAKYWIDGLDSMTALANI